MIEAMIEWLPACMVTDAGELGLAGEACLFGLDAEQTGGVIGFLVMLGGFMVWLARRTARAARTVLQPRPGWPVVSNLPDLPPWQVARREQAGLVARIDAGGAVAIRAAVAGMGGMGKTTLAHAAAHDLKSRLQGIWIVECANIDVLRSSLERLAQHLNAPGADSPNREVAARAALDALRARTDPWLLIYDNADDPALITRWLPQGCPHVRVILTSRASNWPDHELIELGAMTPAESRAMLHGGLPLRQAERLDDLAQRLSHWPLALTAAIGYLTVHRGTSVAEYLTQFDLRRVEMQRTAWAGLTYADPTRAETLTIAAAMRLTTDRLAPDDRDLLSLLVWLNPDDLWPDIVAKGAASQVRDPFDDSSFPDFLTRAGQDTALVTQGMDRLRAVSLVFDRENLVPDRPDEKSAQMHRLFAELWRTGLDDPALWSNAAARVVNCQVPYHNDTEVNWKTCARLTGHARALLAAGADSLAAARLFHQIGGFLLHRGPQPGDTALPQASADIRARLAPGTESHAASLNNLAQFQQASDDLTGALATNQQVREIRAALPEIGPDHPSYAATLNNIAGVHWAKGDHAAAEPLILEALRIDTAALGEAHPATIIDHRNLGVVYGEWAQTAPPDQAGVLRTKEAQAKATALDLSLRVNGPRHQDTAIDRNNAAVRLAQAGDMPGALHQMRSAAAIQLDMLPQHPWATQSLQDYVAIAFHTGQPRATLLPALVAEARLQRAAHVAWGQAKLADLLRDHGIDGEPSNATLTALENAIAARQATMQAEGKPVQAWTWPRQQIENALHAATLPPDLPSEFEPDAARMLAALDLPRGLPDNGRRERTTP